MSIENKIVEALGDSNVIKVHCKRAYRGKFVDVRSTVAYLAIEKNKDIVVTCDDFPGQQMTIKPEEVESLKAFENENLKYGDEGNQYTLKAYQFNPD